MSLWERDVVLEKGKGAIRVSIQEFKGKERFDVRFCYWHKTGHWTPTQKGVMISPDRIEDVITALVEGRNRFIENRST